MCVCVEPTYLEKIKIIREPITKIVVYVFLLRFHFGKLINLCYVLYFVCIETKQVILCIPIMVVDKFMTHIRAVNSLYTCRDNHSDANGKVRKARTRAKKC